MIYQRLGNSGLKISALSYGSWVSFGSQIGVKEADALMGFAYDKGINFFDNAEVYANGKSEVIMGEVLKKNSWSRDSYCISSKVFWGGEKPTQVGLSRKHVFDACHAALKRMQVDYLDLYFCHRPDPETPVSETVRAMHDLITQGKVLYWGTSEWDAPRLQEAYVFAKENYLIPPTMEQPQYNLFSRKNVEQNLKPLFQSEGLGSTIWSPLASGLLTGKYDDGIPEDSRLALPSYAWLLKKFNSPLGQKRLKSVKELAKIAKDLGASTAALSIAWCLKNPHVSTVILGATKVDQLKENLKALDVLPRLTPEVVKTMETITSGLEEEN